MRSRIDPDRRVQEAIALVFRKFAGFGSIRQVHLWLRQEGVELPSWKMMSRARTWSAAKAKVAPPSVAGRLQH